MIYDFEKQIDRHHTSCVKYDMMTRDFGRDDLQPMWVADMDVATPDFILDDLRKRLEHPVLGYTFGDSAYVESIQHWLEKRYAIHALKEELHYIPGIVAGIAFCLQAFTRENDPVVVMTPVYPPFLNLPLHGKRELCCSPLQIADGRFVLDFDDLEQRIEGARMLILSNPHNPGGRVWSPDELRHIASLCARHKVIVIADEIHADLTLPGHNHTSFSTVSEEARENSITFIAPSKTFNIAGLSSSIAYIPNEALRQTFFHYIDGYELANGNLFAYIGTQSAFSKGEAWLGQFLEFLQGNIQYTRSFVRKHLPEIRVMLPEASFLLWMDFSATGLSHEELRERLIQKGKIALNDGMSFGGESYKGFFRMNIGCPRSVLEEGLHRIVKALSND